MAVAHLGPDYDFPSANREECYGGDINFYIQWERHLLIACPSAYRAPRNMIFGDFLENLFRPDYAVHPDTAKLDFSQCEWRYDKQPWQPDLSKSLADNGIGHMGFIQFRSPGLDGLHGVGN
ncbi:MAG: phenol hydroxylase subunit P4 [Gammaproteobacteria bacterium]